MGGRGTMMPHPLMIFFFLGYFSRIALCMLKKRVFCRLASVPKKNGSVFIFCFVLFFPLHPPGCFKGDRAEARISSHKNLFLFSPFHDSTLGHKPGHYTPFFCFFCVCVQFPLPVLSLTLGCRFVLCFFVDFFLLVRRLCCAMIIFLCPQASFHIHQGRVFKP